MERERVARVKERERSMREEHVDGGFLVTQGVYVGTEDFNKAVVRHLMVSLSLSLSVFLSFRLKPERWVCDGQMLILIRLNDDWLRFGEV